MSATPHASNACDSLAAMGCCSDAPSRAQQEAQFVICVYVQRMVNQTKAAERKAAKRAAGEGGIVKTPGKRSKNAST